MRTSLRTWFTAALVAICWGCNRHPVPSQADEGASWPPENLRVEILPDGTSWQCVSRGLTYVFRDPDNDGLTASCDIYKGNVLRRKVDFPAREYEGMPFVPGGLNADNLDGVNLIMTPFPPMPRSPMRSERTRDPRFLDPLCKSLNENSYRGTMLWVKDDPCHAVGTGSFGSIPYWQSLGMELWFKGDNEPLVILLWFVDEPYDSTGSSLVARRRGESQAFGNDEITALLSGFSGATRYDQMRETFIFQRWVLPVGPFRQPGYYGGIPINPDGKPARTVTLADRVNQARDLLKIYEEHMRLD